MKRIRLLSLPDPKAPDSEDRRVDYRLTIEQAVRIPLDRQNGATIDEMRRGIRILDALDRTSVENAHSRDNHDVLELEDADWEFLKRKVEKMPWAVVDRRFVQFHDDITNATDAARDSTHANSVA